jgi:signal transduction histidine kinase/CheY-like chemotaxis protein
VGACATLLAALQLFLAARAEDSARLRLEADLAVSALQQRLDAQVALLRGAAGLFAASDHVGAQEFAAYVTRLGLTSHYPGVLGIGYARLVHGEAARDGLEAEMRRQGATDFRVWPQFPRQTYTSILYLWPLNRRNEAAIGYDMFTNPTRREAMSRALALGEPAVTGVVELVQEIDARKQPGFLIYLAVGRHDPAKTGFVYSPLRAGDLLQTVFPARPDRVVDVAIYDGAPQPGKLLYRTPPSPKSRMTTLRQIEVAGRAWSMVVDTRPAFEARSKHDVAYWTLGLGSLSTLALTLAVFAQARAGIRAAESRNALAELNATLEDRVLGRTRELASANAVLRDEMARREAAESQMRQMQRMEAIGQLTGGIAHDFNNMLAVIVGSLDMARRRLGEQRPEVARYIDTADEGARRAASLTARLLAFARRQQLRPAPLDANRLLGGMAELLERALGEGIEMSLRLEEGLWPVHADAPGLENAVLNLAVNARDAMGGSGRLVITTKNVAEGAPRSGEHVAMRVEDAGPGMPPEVAERAFEPFFTTKEVGKGSGLGLSQVYGFVSQSGGMVTLETREGEGTAITIWLPRWRGVLPQPAPQSAPAEAETPRARAREAVLVVEDEPEVRRFSVEALRELGYAVVQAEGGAEALARLKAGEAVDLLFTDVVMPGMTGRELAARARALRPGLKVLYTTGYSPESLGDAANAGGMVLGKPFTVDQLARTVRQVLDADQA